MTRRGLTGLVFGQLGRLLLAGHPLGCKCASCLELDGHADALAGMFEEAAVDPPPIQAPRPPARVEITDVRVVQNTPRPRRALPAPSGPQVAAEVDGRPVRAELVRVESSKPTPKRRRRSPRTK